MSVDVHGLVFRLSKFYSVLANARQRRNLECITKASSRSNEVTTAPKQFSTKTKRALLSEELTPGGEINSTVALQSHLQS